MSTWRRVPVDALGKEIIHRARNGHDDPAIRRSVFAGMVIKRLATGAGTVAVINECGKAAFVVCSDRQYDVLCRDNPIIGIYNGSATARDIIEDLAASDL